jgi:cephalosporin hydroxylase
MRSKRKDLVYLCIASILIAAASFWLGTFWFTLSARGSLSGTDSLENRVGAPLAKTLAMMQGRIDRRTSYFGVPAQKCPVDHWVYQEIVFETRPDVIIEIGTAWGGGLLGLAHFCDLMDHGRVIGIDIDLSRVAQVVRDHPRVTLIESDACQAFPQVASLIQPGEKVMVIEDSAHTYENTLAVLRTYSSLVAAGCYFVVEDSICHHGVNVGPKPGPYEAIETFMKETDRFAIDRSRESFGITWNPIGYLKCDRE